MSLIFISFTTLNRMSLYKRGSINGYQIKISLKKSYFELYPLLVWPSFAFNPMESLLLLSSAMFHNLIPAECLPAVTKGRRELAEMLDHVNELFMVYK